MWLTFEFLNLEFNILAFKPEMNIAPPFSAASHSSNVQLPIKVLLPMMFIPPALFGEVQESNVESVIFTLLPVTNIAPPSVSSSFASASANTLPNVKLDFVIVTFEPVIHIVPPFEVEPS